VPYIIRPPRKRTLVSALTTAIVSLAAAPGLARADGTAGPACPAEAAASPLLAGFGDNAEYTLLPGSRFEGAAPGWTFRNAALTPEGSVSSITGNGSSLVIASGGEAVSPAFCVSSEYPSFRFFERRLSVGFGGMAVNLRYKDDFGYTHEVSSATLQSGSSSWSLTPVLGLASMLPLWQWDATLKVHLVFRAQGYGSSWAIDDVFIDPYRK
jgi:hypothetical protein